MKMKILSAVLMSVCSFPPVWSQGEWVTRPFEQKVFVENKGQFGRSAGVEQEILFKTVSGGTNIYFTKQGVIYRCDEEIQETAAEKAERKRGKRERKISLIKHGLEMQWLGSNPDVEIVADEKVSFYYSYSFDPSQQRSGIRASAYKKIIYRNLYPKIDVEYVLPELGGVKYNLILHPGADVNNVKMKWGGLGLRKDTAGNLVIKGSMGDFIDHAPITFYENSPANTIASSFVKSNDVVSFQLAKYDRTRKVIVDPWVTSPNFSGYNAAYDVDYDFARNVYAYGGDGWTNPFELIKMNSAGAIQWVFVTSVFTSSAWYSYYGDFAVDGYSQSVYIAEGMNTSPGSRVLKLNPAGNQVAIHPGSDLKEIWRVNYNSCKKQGVLGGSGWDQAYEAAVFDTTLTVINPVHMLNTSGLQDLGIMAIDNQNNCFMGFGTNGTSANNQLLKCPANTLLPSNYLVGNHFELAEIQSQSYVNNSTGTNGMNGMAVNSTDLYTYNGYKVKRHSKNTGAVLDSAKLTPPQYATFSTKLLIYWGGIAVDECNNIFVGSHDTIYQLDFNLNKVATILAPGTVYDLKLSSTSDTLYAAGKNFVALIHTNITCNNMNISVAAAGSCATSSATVTATGGSAPYTYLWNPSGQTSQTASALSTGTYTVTVWDSSCPPIIKTTTISITGGALSASVSVTPSACLTSNGSATVTPTGGAAPFTYSWSPSGGNAATANGLSTGTYSVTITDASGCSGTTTVSIAASNGPNVTITGLQNVLCSGGSTGAGSASVSGGVSPYTYGWSNGQSSSAASNLSAGNYTVMVTDAGGCTQTQVLSINEPPPIVATATATAATCGNSDGTAIAVGSGGTPAYTYAWSNAQSTSAISGLAPGNYTVTISDANGCSQTATAGVAQSGGPTATVGINVTILQGTSTTLSSSAPGAVTYSWTPTTGLSCSNCSNPTASPVQTTEYCVYTYDATGCYDSACVTVYVATVPEPTNCSQSVTGEMHLPSAFSPNDDGQNDKITLLFGYKDCIETFEISIFNRWGEEVIQSEDPYFVWDGKYKGELENTAVFAYVIQATLKSGEEIKMKGNISLLR